MLKTLIQIFHTKDVELAFEVAGEYSDMATRLRCLKIQESSVCSNPVQCNPIFWQKTLYEIRNRGEIFL